MRIGGKPAYRFPDRIAAVCRNTAQSGLPGQVFRYARRRSDGQYTAASGCGDRRAAEAPRTAVAHHGSQLRAFQIHKIATEGHAVGNNTLLFGALSRTGRPEVTGRSGRDFRIKGPERNLLRKYQLFYAPQEKQKYVNSQSAMDCVK